VRPLSDLLNVERPALPALLTGVSAAGQRATLLPVRTWGSLGLGHGDFLAESRTGSVHGASVPWAEVVAFTDEMAAQLSVLPDGAKFRIGPTG
jgi:hypothetical protein